MNKIDQTASNTGWLQKAVVRKIAGAFNFTEGPVWHPEQYFLFSDTPANCIYKLFADGSYDVFYRGSGLTHNHTEALSHQLGSNGLALDAEDNLYICQHGNHGIAVLNKENELHTLISEYKGKPFNSPNDITLRSDGIVYFTDPPYGLTGEVLNPAEFQPLAGVYKYAANHVELISTDFNYPNGLVFSPDEKYLYVGTNHPDEKKILRYNVDADGNISSPEQWLEENADGMTRDRNGNIYLAVKKGILVAAPSGKRLGLIEIPDTPTNLAWDAREEQMLVTAAAAVYFIEK